MNMEDRQANVFCESQHIPALEECVVTFSWAGHIGGKKYRNVLHHPLKSLVTQWKQNQAEAYNALIRPPESFLNDITLRQAQRASRPIVSIASSPVGDQSVTLLRPAEYAYDVEGRHVTIKTDDKNRRKQFAFRDAFALFEDGTIYYLMSLHADKQAGGMHAYTAIQLQQFGHPNSPDIKNLEWRYGNETFSDLSALRSFRLKELAARPHGAKYSFIADLVQKSGLVFDEPLTWFDDDVRSVTLSIKDPFWLNLIDNAADYLQADDVTDGEEANQPGDGAPHLDERYSKEMAGILALGGVAQAILDFPHQDKRELLDALEPSYAKDGMAVFYSPGGLVEIASDWRSLDVMKDTLGGCPYLLLTHLATDYNKLIIERMEKMSDYLLAGTDNPKINNAPLTSLRDQLDKSLRRIFVGPSDELRESLEMRFDLYQNNISQFGANIFRYEEERELFSKIIDIEAIEQRFDHALMLFDRYEMLIEDVQDAAALASSKRMNQLLFLISSMSIISVVSDVVGFTDFNLTSGNKILLILVALLGFIALAFTMRMAAAKSKRSRSYRRIVAKYHRKS